MRLALCTAAAMAALSMTGCLLPWAPDKDPPCQDPDDAVTSYRNPENGQCDDLGGGGCGEVVPATAALPAWAVCYAGCEGLDEGTCIATADCRAVYLQPSGANVATYLDCWGIAPTGPQQGSCEGLDAQACSTRNDCSAVYGDSSTPRAPIEDALWLAFNYCQSEGSGGCYADSECAPGWDCTADTECLPPPGCGADGIDCPAVCYGRCVQVDACSNAYCGPGYHCEEQCAPCDAPDGSMCGCSTTCVPNQACPDSCGPGSHCETYCTGVDQPPPDGGTMDPSGGATPDAGVPPIETCTTICVPDAPPSCAAYDCAPGYHCEDTCAPWGGGGMTPGGTDAGATQDPALVPPSCPVCVPDVPDPGECYGVVADWQVAPACPSGTTPGTRDGGYTGYCIPISECGNDPGSCYGGAACDSLPPSCPVGTMPGIRDNCWSGYCIPTWACEGQPCEAIGDAAECSSRRDCTPIYTGTGCVCDVNGICTCEETSFARCETAFFPL